MDEIAIFDLETRINYGKVSGQKNITLTIEEAENILRTLKRKTEKPH